MSVHPETRRAILEIVRTDFARGVYPRTTDAMRPELRRQGLHVLARKFMQVVRSTAIDASRPQGTRRGTSRGRPRE
jgi:hypothetical protein